MFGKKISKTNPNYRVLGIGALFLIPPGWVVFMGMRTLAAFPLPVAAATIAGLAVVAVTLVFIGLQNLEAGDVKDARLQFVAAAVIGASEFAGQWWFALTEHHALVTALVLSLLSVGGGVIIESEIMRVWRANARQDGLMSLPRAQVPAEVRRQFPEVAARAVKLAVRYPNATQASVLQRAFAEQDAIDAERAAEVARVQRTAPVQVRVDVAELLPAAPPVAVEALPLPAGSPEFAPLPAVTAAVVGDTSADLGDASADLGDASADLGDASADLGDASADLGDASAVSGDTSAVSGDAPAVPVPVPAVAAKGRAPVASVAALTRSVVDLVGSDPVAVIAEVRRQRPSASVATIRRVLADLERPAVAEPLAVVPKLVKAPAKKAPARRRAAAAGGSPITAEVSPRSARRSPTAAKARAAGFTAARRDDLPPAG